MSSSENANNEQNQQQPPTQEQEQNTTTAEAIVTTENKTEGGGGFTDRFDKQLQGYGEEYMDYVMSKADEKTYTITLNKPTGQTEPDPLDPTIQRPIYEGFEEKTYISHPISPQDWHRAEKLRAKFQTEKDPDKVADNQIATYKFLAFCYLKMPASDFDRVTNWNQLKMAVDSCNFKVLYRPLKK